MELTKHGWLALQTTELWLLPNRRGGQISPSREMPFVTQPGARRWPRGVLCHIGCCRSGSAV